MQGYGGEYQREDNFEAYKALVQEGVTFIDTAEVSTSDKKVYLCPMLASHQVWPTQTKACLAMAWLYGSCVSLDMLCTVPSVFVP
jgi:hypothetical protein